MRDVICASVPSHAATWYLLLHGHTTGDTRNPPLLTNMHTELEETSHGQLTPGAAAAVAAAAGENEGAPFSRCHTVSRHRSTPVRQRTPPCSPLQLQTAQPRSLFTSPSPLQRRFGSAVDSDAMDWASPVPLLNLGTVAPMPRCDTPGSRARGVVPPPTSARSFASPVRPPGNHQCFRSPSAPSLGVRTSSAGGRARRDSVGPGGGGGASLCTSTWRVRTDEHLHERTPTRPRHLTPWR